MTTCLLGLDRDVCSRHLNTARRGLTRSLFHPRLKRSHVSTSGSLFESDNLSFAVKYAAAKLPNTRRYMTGYMTTFDCFQSPARSCFD